MHCTETGSKWFNNTHMMRALIMDLVDRRLLAWDKQSRDSAVYIGKADVLYSRAPKNIIQFV